MSRRSKAASPPASAPSAARPLAAILLAGAAIRCAYLWSARDDLFTRNLLIDAKAYDGWALQILGGDWLGSGASYQDPLYAYLLAACYAVFGHAPAAARVLQALLDCGSIVLLFALGKRLFGPRAGLAAAGLWALYGPAVFYTNLLDKTSLASFAALASLALSCGAGPSSVPRLALGGLTAGMAGLLRGNCLIAGLGVAAWLGLRGREARPAAGAYLLGMGLAIVPVTLRNYALHRDFILVAPNTGLNFFIGNNPATPGNYVEPPFISGVPEHEYADSKLAAERIGKRPLAKPSQVSRYWLREGLRFIARRPAAWLALEGRKAFLALNRFEIPETYSFYRARDASAALAWPRVGFGLLAPLGLLGAWLARRQEDARPLRAFLAGYLASLLLFFVTSRYRMPLAVALTPFAGHALAALPAALRAAGARQRLVAAALLLLAAGASNAQPRWLREHVRAPGLSTAHTLAGQLLLEQGRLEESRRELRAAADLYPRGAHIHALLGAANAQAGDFRAALDCYARALSLDPYSDEVHAKAAEAFAALGDRDLAREALLRAIELRPQEPVYRERLERLGYGPK